MTAVGHQAEGGGSNLRQVTQIVTSLDDKNRHLCRRLAQKALFSAPKKLARFMQ
jgi:hypothetical protein